MDGEKKPNSTLRRERQLRGWSQQKVAESIGTSEDVGSEERGNQALSSKSSFVYSTENLLKSLTFSRRTRAQNDARIPKKHL